MSLSWSPPSAFFRRDGGDFVSGKDSLSAGELQWGGERRTDKGKTFPHIGKSNLFYLLFRNRMPYIRLAEVEIKKCCAI
jgi:hypothetical protein